MMHIYNPVLWRVNTHSGWSSVCIKQQALGSLKGPMSKKKKKLHKKISEVDICPPHALANTLIYKHIYAQSKIRQKPAWWHTQFYHKGGEGKRILSSAWTTETLTQKTTKGLEKSLRR